MHFSLRLLWITVCITVVPCDDVVWEVIWSEFIRFYCGKWWKSLNLAAHDVQEKTYNSHLIVLFHLCCQVAAVRMTNASFARWKLAPVINWRTWSPHPTPGKAEPLQVLNITWTHAQRVQFSSLGSGCKHDNNTTQSYLVVKSRFIYDTTLLAGKDK